MTVIISGDTGIDTVGSNTVGSSQVLDGSIPMGKLSFTPLFTQEYVSPEQTITAAGLLTLAHGLGAVPKFVTGYIVCKTAEHGYSIGDVVWVTLMNVSSSSADHFGAQCKVDATNVLVRLGTNPFLIGRWTDGASVQIVSANWRLIIRAWA